MSPSHYYVSLCAMCRNDKGGPQVNMGQSVVVDFGTEDHYYMIEGDSFDTIIENVNQVLAARGRPDLYVDDVIETDTAYGENLPSDVSVELICTPRETRCVVGLDLSKEQNQNQNQEKEKEKDQEKEKEKTDVPETLRAPDSTDHYYVRLGFGCSNLNEDAPRSEGGGGQSILRSVVVDFGSIQSYTACESTGFVGIDPLLQQALQARGEHDLSVDTDAIEAECIMGDELSTGESCDFVFNDSRVTGKRKREQDDSDQETNEKSSVTPKVSTEDVQDNGGPKKLARVSRVEFSSNVDFTSKKEKKEEEKEEEKKEN